MTDTIDERDDRHDDLSTAARTLHREWESPRLWPSIADRIAADERTSRSLARLPWTGSAAWRLATAAALLLAAGFSAMWAGGWLFRPAERAVVTGAPSERLLTEQALTEIERAETQYIEAIEALARTAGPRIAQPESPLLLNLRERLLAIDTAIADCRAEIERNRFNAHLRRHLLSIYQEKRRTLEQILEDPSNVL